jgi:viroplasmin and RNaseH domain-containing protein
MKDVWVYQGKELKVFASAEAAQEWFDENDPEGVAFKCEVEGVTVRAGAERCAGLLKKATAVGAFKRSLTA